jgi:DNA-directed RNA polymerase I subunit RPA2
MQQTGFTIIADKLNNMRFLSHFRSLHRGAYFAEMKTTTVRKLLPESWGFVCPVHTPDGGPCGLLNHLAMQCQPLTHPDPISARRVESLLPELGVQALSFGITYPPTFIPLLLNGRLFGYVHPQLAKHLQDAFRLYKSDGTISEYTEFAYIPSSGQHRTPVFPGVFIDTQEAKLVRPVRNLRLNSVEWITPLE